MLQRRVISAAVALAISAIGLITTAAKTKDEIIEAESHKKGRRYSMKYRKEDKQ